MIPYHEHIAEGQTFPVGDAPKFVTYEQFVTNLVKERGEESKNLEHMVIGICGEAGEIADGIKKNSIYGKPLDLKNIIEELGDIEFYLAGLRQMLGISRYETLGTNVRKLQARYKDGYSDAAAIERADKKEPLPPSLLSDFDNKPGPDYYWSNVDQMWIKPQVLDVTSQEYKEARKAEVPPITEEQVAAVDEQAVIIHDWCVPLLQAYHAGKKVVAIGYTNHTATVLFDGDPQPYKLYKPKGEQ